jgi:hypothetical protein
VGAKAGGFVVVTHPAARRSQRRVSVYTVSSKAMIVIRHKMPDSDETDVDPAAVIEFLESEGIEYNAYCHVDGVETLILFEREKDAVLMKLRFADYVTTIPPEYAKEN